MRTALAIRMSAGVEAPVTSGRAAGNTCREVGSLEAPVTSGRAAGSTCREVGSPHSPGGIWVGLASRA